MPLTLWSEMTRLQRETLCALVSLRPIFAASRSPLRALERMSLAEHTSTGWRPTDLGRQVATRPLVFLDMDGVCARVVRRDAFPGETKEAWLARQATASERLDAPSMLRLNKIANLTDARFVMSSTWRTTPRATPALYETCMRLKGFTGRLIGFTPVLPSGSREAEIETYLQGLPSQPRAFAVLEDFEPMVRLASRTVRTNEDTLISDADVERVVKLLSPPTWTVRKKDARGAWRVMYEGSEAKAERHYERYAKRALRGAVELLDPEGLLVEGQTFE